MWESLKNLSNFMPSLKIWNHRITKLIISGFFRTLKFKGAIIRLPHQSIFSSLTHLFGAWPFLLLIAPQAGWAVGTTSGTTISNRATVTYVIGVAAPFIEPSNTVSFLVDKKVNLLVAETSGSSTSVNIGQTGAVATFQVTNLGNDPQGFNLAAALATGNPAPGGTAPFTTNDFNATGLQVFVDSNANGVYDPGVDTATSIPTLASGSSQKVFIVADIPATVVNGQQSVVSLTATAVAPATMVPLVATVGPDTAGLDVMFADSTGVAVGDIASDAKHSAYAAYFVSTVNVALTKSVTSVIDPNGTAELVPGAVMTYQITVVLSGNGTATNLVITDPLPTDTTYVPGSIIVGGVAKSDAADADNAQFAANTVSVSLGNVAAPANFVITFRATIN
jgi:uncharacterized repeat protein (TIGR01451 family)